MARFNGRMSPGVRGMIAAYTTTDAVIRHKHGQLTAGQDFPAARGHHRSGPVGTSCLASRTGRPASSSEGQKLYFTKKRGLIPAVDPILFHYMMVSLSATLSEFGPEMRVTSGLSSEDPNVAAAYWRLVDEMVFGKDTNRNRGGKANKR